MAGWLFSHLAIQPSGHFLKMGAKVGRKPSVANEVELLFC
jgi:hypothetical protein